MRHMPKSYSQIHVDNQNVLWAYLPNSTLSQVASFSTFQLQTLPYCAILQPTDLSDLVWHCSLLLLWIPKPFCESSWVWQVLICLGQSPEHVWYVCLYVSLVLNQCTVLLYIIIISVVILYHYHSDYQCHCLVILIVDMCNILSYDWYDEICILFRCISYFDHLGYSFTPELLTQSRRPGPKGKTLHWHWTHWTWRCWIFWKRKLEILETWNGLRSLVLRCILGLPGRTSRNQDTRTTRHHFCGLCKSVGQSNSK